MFWRLHSDHPVDVILKGSPFIITYRVPVLLQEKDQAAIFGTQIVVMDDGSNDPQSGIPMVHVELFAGGGLPAFQERK